MELFLPQLKHTCAHPHRRRSICRTRRSDEQAAAPAVQPTGEYLVFSWEWPVIRSDIRFFFRYPFKYWILPAIRLIFFMQDILRHGKILISGNWVDRKDPTLGPFIIQRPFAECIRGYVTKSFLKIKRIAIIRFD